MKSINPINFDRTTQRVEGHRENLGCPTSPSAPLAFPPPKRAFLAAQVSNRSLTAGGRGHTAARGRQCSMRPGMLRRPGASMPAGSRVKRLEKGLKEKVGPTLVL